MSPPVFPCHSHLSPLENVLWHNEANDELTSIQNEFQITVSSAIKPRLCCLYFSQFITICCWACYLTNETQYQGKPRFGKTALACNLFWLFWALWLCIIDFVCATACALIQALKLSGLLPSKSSGLCCGYIIDSEGKDGHVSEN